MSSQRVKVTYAMLFKHLGRSQADMLTQVVWKDGIDIRVVPTVGIQSLVDECVALALANYGFEFK